MSSGVLAGAHHIRLRVWEKKNMVVQSRNGFVGQGGVFAEITEWSGNPLECTVSQFGWWVQDTNVEGDAPLTVLEVCATCTGVQRSEKND